MLQITYYTTKESFDLKSINIPIKKKASTVLKKWEDDNPEAILKYVKVID